MITDDVLLQHKWKRCDGNKWRKNGVIIDVNNDKCRVYLHFIINERRQIYFSAYHPFENFDSDIHILERDIARGIMKILFKDEDYKGKVSSRAKRAFYNWIQ